MKPTSKHPRWTYLLPLVGACIAIAGCRGGENIQSYMVAVEGNPEHGAQIIQEKGCGACHTIPGIYTARGMVGPPLTQFAARTMIAGELPNSPDNLFRWLKDPQQVEPGTAMPDLNLTDEQERDIAAYLYTLR